MPYIEFNPPNINGLSLAMVPKNSRVLDLGCGAGHQGDFMQKKLGCEVIGVENDKKSAKIATKRISKVIFRDIENQKIQNLILKQKRVDVIYASNILEHLKQPQVILQQLKKSLKKSGIIIITLPNIAHWSIRLNLLFGNLNYTKTGILDKTHLKFFTIKTAINFIEKDCLLKIKKIEYDFPELPLISKVIKFVFGPKIQQKLFQCFPNLFAYQMAFKTTPK